MFICVFGTCGGQRLASGTYFYWSLSYFLRCGCSPNLMNKLAKEPPSPFPMGCDDRLALPYILFFLQGCWGSTFKFSCLHSKHIIH